MNRMTSGLALGLVGLAIGAGMGWSQRSRPISLDSSPTPSVEVRQSIEVHVAGWVMEPGVVELSDGAIVAEAVAAAGGMRPGARADLINLAAPVSDGGQIVVPGPEDDRNPTGGPASDGVVSLNRADAGELETLPGVGPVLAERIVAHREQIGGFKRIEDLLQVPGIGESKLDALRDLVRP